MTSVAQPGSLAKNPLSYRIKTFARVMSAMRVAKWAMNADAVAPHLPSHEEKEAYPRSAHMLLDREGLHATYARRVEAAQDLQTCANFLPLVAHMLPKATVVTRKVKLPQ